MKLKFRKSSDTCTAIFGVLDSGYQGRCGDINTTDKLNPKFEGYSLDEVEQVLKKMKSIRLRNNHDK